VTSAAFSPGWLAARLASLLPAFPGVSLCVALSGGVDSVTLLAALASLQGESARTRARPKRAARSGIALRAIHVHHGLHPNADQWTDHCRALARRLAVPLVVLRVEVARPRGASLEAAARNARYAALAKALRPGEVLLTAHHQDDQLETVFLQLLRGAGIAGLAAMPEIAPFAQGQLVRPLLGRTRAELESWARDHDLDWVEDDSNVNERFDRNYLRRTVLPLVRARWPGAGASVARSARHAAEARRLLDALALADVERASVGASLSVQTLRALDRDRCRNALRFWIARRGATVPDTRRLDELAGPLLDARADANPRVQWNDTALERHADILSIRDISNATAAGAESDAVMWDWRASPRLQLVASGGTLAIVSDRLGPLDLDALAPALSVRRRRGGERLRPRENARTRTLKALLQEARIRPAERDRLPLIYSDDRLIAVADRWLDASAQATAKTQRRGRFRWQPK